MPNPSKRGKLRFLFILHFLFLTLALAAVACGGGDGQPPAGTPAAETAAAGEQLNAVIISSDLAVGSNRFVVGLITQDNELVTDAQLHFRIFNLDGDQDELRFEAEPDTILVEHVAVYVAGVEFDETGTWGVEVSGTRDGEPFEPVTEAFTVLEVSQTLAVGELAPLSVQTIVSDVADITEIDSSDPPIPEMHNMTIAEAVTSGKPTVIVIATPAFCLSRICGPTKQIVDQVYADYKGQANFVHVEPYDLEKARSGEGLEVMSFLEQDWGLLTEPWVFLVDKDGNIAAKFEAVVSQKELEDALQRIL